MRACLLSVFTRVERACVYACVRACSRERACSRVRAWVLVGVCARACASWGGYHSEIREEAVVGGRVRRGREPVLVAELRALEVDVRHLRHPARRVCLRVCTSVAAQPPAGRHREACAGKGGCSGDQSSVPSFASFFSNALNTCARCPLEPTAVSIPPGSAVEASLGARMLAHQCWRKESPSGC